MLHKATRSAMKTTVSAVALFLLAGCGSGRPVVSHTPLELRNGSYFVETKTTRQNVQAAVEHCGERKVVINTVIPPKDSTDGIGMVFSCR